MQNSILLLLLACCGYWPNMRVDACPYMEQRQRQLQNNNNNILSVQDAVALPAMAVEEALALARQDIRSILTANRAAEFVRLAFHDCVGGVCDGCIDTSNPDNFGLDDPIEHLAGYAIRYSATLTRADLWVWAGMVAAEATQDDSSIAFPMEYTGRPVCEGEPNRGPHRNLPSAHITTGELITFMEDNFQFTPREATAILGAHTLGEANEQNSGFDGGRGWVRNEDDLDNAFYRTLLDGADVDEDFQLELQQNNNRPFPDQYLWRRGNRDDFMLNVDIALARDLEGFVDPITGFVTCDLNNECPDSSLLGFAMEYANSNTLWVTDFRNAFVKMTSIGCSNGVVECTPVASFEATLEANAAATAVSAASPSATILSLLAAIVACSMF